MSEYAGKYETEHQKEPYLSKEMDTIKKEIIDMKQKTYQQENQKESHVFTEMNILKKEISVLKENAKELLSGLLPILVDEKTELTTDAKEPATDYLVPLADDIRSLRRQVAGVSFALASAVRRLEL